MSLSITLLNRLFSGPKRGLGALTLRPVIAILIFIQLVHSVLESYGSLRNRLPLPGRRLLSVLSIIYLLQRLFAPGGGIINSRKGQLDVAELVVLAGWFCTCQGNLFLGFPGRNVRGLGRIIFESTQR